MNSLSIIIPVYNEELYIQDTIKAITKHIPATTSFEVIIVNNASTDNSQRIIQESISNLPNFSIINLPQAVSVAKARNIGVAHSTFKSVIAFIDGDIKITEQWADSIIKNHLNGTDDTNFITGSPVDISETPSAIEEAWFRPLLRKNASYINSGNLILSYSLFEKLNGFDENLITGEDYNLSMRAKALGHPPSINRTLHVFHEGFPKNTLNFFKRELWHGAGDTQSLRHFIKSKTAILSSCYTVSLLVGICTSVLSTPTLTSIAFLISLVILCIFYGAKFNTLLDSKILNRFLLIHLYLLARSLSFIRRR